MAVRSQYHDKEWERGRVNEGDIVGREREMACESGTANGLQTRRASKEVLVVGVVVAVGESSIVDSGSPKNREVYPQDFWDSLLGWER